MRAFAASVVLLLSFGALAEELPLALQVEMLQKTAAYITNLVPPESGKLKVLVVYAGASPSRATETLAAAINKAGKVGAHPAEAKVAALGASAKELLEAEKPQLVWVAQETSEKDVSAVIEACGSSPIVTVSNNPAHVKQGIIMGYELVEAKPRILVHLKQARAQGVVIFSGLL